MIDQAKSAAGLVRLSSQERKVFNLLILGHGQKHIAHVLGIKVKTVSGYKITVLQKLGLRSSVELGIFANRAGLA